MARKKFHQKFKRKKLKEAELETVETEKPKKKFGRRILNALPLMILALIFTFAVNRAGLFVELENWFLDTQMKLAAPARDSQIVIIDITKQDFSQIFQSRSRPLDPAQMQKLIEAIADGEPCVIGVDIDTSFPEFKNFKVSPKLSNVVWEREPRAMPEDVDQKPEMLNVLGGQNPELNARSGVPFLIDDSKKVTRYYTRLIETTEGKMPSLAYAIFREAKNRNCEQIKFPDLEESDNPLIIGYARGTSGAGRARISAGSVLKFAENPNWRDNRLIKNKIVLLGGSYYDDDKHDTPLGTMDGVEITANVVETELGGGGIKPPGTLIMILLQIFDGILLVALFQIFSWRKAILLCLPLIAVIALACSFLTYYSFAQWLFFVPVMIGVIIAEFFDKAKEHFKKIYQREIKNTYQELSGKPPGEIETDED